MLKTKKITNTIVLVQAESQEQLNKTFLRFQEHYESPEWRGRVFTEGQFRSWYSNTYGANTYEKDWSGFNFSSNVFDPFIKGLFGPLSAQEQEMLSLFRYRTGPFYVIGAQDEDSTLDHEICHGLYYTVPNYKKEVDKVLAKYHNELKVVYNWVSLKMYHPSVFADEVHAYVSANDDYLTEIGVAFPKEAHTALRAIKNKHFKEDKQ